MHVETVNVGRIRSVRLRGRTVTTAIWKYPVSGPIEVSGVNLHGDDQADRSVHGGPDKAVYAYALEDTAWWEGALGRRLGPGAFGENLSLRGVDVNGARIGERWAVGSALLEVRQPRLPCFKLGLRHSDPLLPRRFARAGRPGAYLAIVEPGAITAGDPVEVVERPRHDVTVALLAHVYLHDRSRSHELLPAQALPDEWRLWAIRQANSQPKGHEMPSESTHVVERFYSAVAAGDVPAALSILGERVEWHEAPGMPYRAERPYHGAAEVAERVLGPINTDVDALALEVRELLDLGRDVAVVGRYTGTARASGHQIDQPFVHVWTLDGDGGVERFRQYTDAERFADALRI